MQTTYVKIPTNPGSLPSGQTVKPNLIIKAAALWQGHIFFFYNKKKTKLQNHKDSFLIHVDLQAQSASNIIYSVTSLLTCNLLQTYTYCLVPQFTIFILSVDGLKPQIFFFYCSSLFGKVKKTVKHLFFLEVHNGMQQLLGMVPICFFNLALGILQCLFSPKAGMVRLRTGKCQMPALIYICTFNYPSNTPSSTANKSNISVSIFAGYSIPLIAIEVHLFGEKILK